jgi:signal transduction histidine kinase
LYYRDSHACTGAEIFATRAAANPGAFWLPQVCMRTAMETPGHAPYLTDALLRISRLARAAGDPQKAMESALRTIAGCLHADCVTIQLLDPDTQRLKLEACHGLPVDAAGSAQTPGPGAAEWVMLHDQARAVPSPDGRFPFIHDRIESEIAVPLRDPDGTPIGVMRVGVRRRHALTAANLPALQVLADETAGVLGRIWQLRQLEDKARQLETLIGTGRAIVLKRDLDDILRTITADALTLLNGRVCALFFHDAAQDRLTLRAITGSGVPDGYTESLAVSDSSLGTVINRRKPVEVYDLRRTEEHHFTAIIHAAGLVSLLACPVQIEAAVIGVLNIYTDQPHRFSNDEKRLFETYAGLSAVAIQNARLYQRVFQTEENLRQNERLTTLGLLAAEIAHEIRNPLTVIRLLFQSLDLEFAGDDPRQRDVAVIEEKLDQLEHIVSRVLLFAKARRELRTRCKLAELIDDTLFLVRLKLRQNRVEVDCQPPPDPDLVVEVNRGQLQQALLNLLLNAMQAMPGGGRITVSAGREREGEHAVAAVRIRDTGPGIPPQIRDQMFQSFLSGRTDGTGLGLAIVKRILLSHNGDVASINSGPDGTTMRLWLPIVDAP